jgi:hypothetical protein
MINFILEKGSLLCMNKNFSVFLNSHSMVNIALSTVEFEKQIFNYNDIIFSNILFFIPNNLFNNFFSSFDDFFSITIFFFNSVLSLFDTSFFISDDLNNIDLFGQVLFSSYLIYVLIGGIILLIALIGSIILTLKFSNEKLVEQNVSRQLSRKNIVITNFKFLS